MGAAVICRVGRARGAGASAAAIAEAAHPMHPLRGGPAAAARAPPARGRRAAAARRRRAPAAASAAAPPPAAADVVVVGAGVIGLSAAAALLEADPAVTVALLDRAPPAAGGATGQATGAGQGYVWQVHRDPAATAAWAAAARSKALWEAQLAAPRERQRTAAALQWQPTGSMLVAAGAADAGALRARAAALAAAGVVGARFLSAAEAAAEEPALVPLPADGGALLVPSDAQLDGRAAAAALLAACADAGGRFTAHVGPAHAAAELLFDATNGAAAGVRTADGREVRAARAVVVAAGAWSGELLAAALGAPAWAAALRPRRGHLLELAPPAGMPPLRRGLMEAGYTKHYTKHYSATGAGAGAAPPPPAVEGADITFTATASKNGTLLVGSSREDGGGWSAAPRREVVAAVLARAAAFLPALAGARPEDADVRVGLRPFSPAGPMVGPVPGVARLFLAAGHEGSGLTLGPATGELLAEHVLGARGEHALGAAAAGALLPRLAGGG